MARKSNELEPVSVSEMIRQTHEMVTDLHHTVYGNGKMGLKTKVDRLWVGARLLTWVAAAVFTALLAFTLK